MIQKCPICSVQVQHGTLEINNMGTSTANSPSRVQFPQQQQQNPVNSTIRNVPTQNVCNLSIIVSWIHI